MLSNDAPDPKLVLVNDGTGPVFDNIRGPEWRWRPDLIVGYVDAPGVMYYNDGTGRNFDAHPFGDGRGAIYGMAHADLNGDGRLDVVAARSDAPSFILFNRAAN